MIRPTFIIVAAAAGLVAGPAPAQTTDASAPAPAPAPAPTPPQAPFTVTGGVTLASQYRFRGISLSDEQVALQGTINVQHESGFYTGIWGSSLDGFGELGGSNLELDLYGGWRHQVAHGVNVDAGLLYYAYPGSHGGDFEFFEPYANVSVTRGPVTAKAGVNYAWSQAALGNNSNRYLYGELSLAIPHTPVTLTSHLGNSHGNTPLTPSGDYLDWSLGATANWNHLTFGVAYVDTNLSAAEAASGGATRDIVDGAVVATLTASF
jgi:uncharacterized protein (TIGR02001 family)